MTFEGAHRLIKTGDLISLRHALDGGLSPNLSNRFRWSLLMAAAIEGNTQIGQLLISRGANLDQLNDFGESALSLAAQQGHPRFVQLLLSAGASTHCRPHGHSLDDWVTLSSGLPKAKIASILDLIRRSRLN